MSLLRDLCDFLRTPRINLVFIGFISLGLLGCQTVSTGGSGPSTAGSHSSATSRLQEILENGALRVGMTANQPPFNMTNKSGEIVGLEEQHTKTPGARIHRNPEPRGAAANNHDVPRTRLRVQSRKHFFPIHSANTHPSASVTQRIGTAKRR